MASNCQYSEKNISATRCRPFLDDKDWMKISMTWFGTFEKCLKPTENKDFVSQDVERSLNIFKWFVFWLHKIFPHSRWLMVHIGFLNWMFLNYLFFHRMISLQMEMVWRLTPSNLINLIVLFTSIFFTNRFRKFRMTTSFRIDSIRHQTFQKSTE